MFLKLVYFGSKICIVSINICFKASHHLQSRKNLCLLHPPLSLRLYTACRLDETFRKSVAGFQKVKVLTYYGYKCLSISKLYGIPSAHAYEIYLKW